MATMSRCALYARERNQISHVRNIRLRQLTDNPTTRAIDLAIFVQNLIDCTGRFASHSASALALAKLPSTRIRTLFRTL